MGGAQLNQDPPLLEDLKLTILSSSILYPSAPSERRSMFLSNIDQVLNFTVETVHFFAANPEFRSEIVAEKLRSAVERVLVPYDFLAGRLRLEEKEGRLEIDCNSAGVEFMVAESKFKLDEIGELEYPNPAFRQLAAAAGVVQEGLKMEDQSLCSFQVTLFKCGGFSMGISNNHVTFDGLSFKNFLENLASLAFDDLLPRTRTRTRAPPPFTDRRLLSTRSPPRVSFPHPELFSFSSNSTSTNSTSTNSILQLSPSVALRFKLLRLSSSAISSLKLLSHPLLPSSFNAVVAHLWRCKSLSSSSAQQTKTSMVLYAVDIRNRISPPLPREYAGNAVLTAYGAAPPDEVAGGDFAKLVEAVAKGAERMGDQYVRSVIDWGALHRGFPRGDIFVSSWWKLGFADVEFPWGKPLYTCPVAHPRSDIVLLFPCIAGLDQGVNVLVALPPDEMDRFQHFFYNLLPPPPPNLGSIN